MSNVHAFAAILGGGILFAGLLVLAACVLVTVFYLLTMQKALVLAGRENRSLEPGLVWLLFIPLFGLVWQFFIVRHVSSAVKNWAAAHGRNVGDGGWAIGLAACILVSLGALPHLGVLVSLAGLVCLIVWWVKVAHFNELMARASDLP